MRIRRVLATAYERAGEGATARERPGHVGVFLVGTVPLKNTVKTHP